MEANRITIWRALLDGECKQIHKGEAQLWRELKERNASYDPAEHDRWSIVATEEEVPVVEGIAHDWSAEGGCGGVHIHWQCPYCQTEHYTDDDPEDLSPYLWFCEHGKGIVLVKLAGT